MEKILMKKILMKEISMKKINSQSIQKKLRKEARERCQNLSEEEKDKKRQYAREQYNFFLQKKKERNVNMVVNDIKTYYRMSIDKIFLECKK